MTTSDVSEDATASALPASDDDDYFSFVLYSVAVPLLYGVVTVLGVAGNSLVIYVIASRERMRTVTNLLLLNLAVADLAFVVVIPPSTAYVFAADRWPFGDAPCRLMHYLVNVTAYVTVYTLVAISAIRYMTIVHSASTARCRTAGRAAATIVVIWMLMAAVNVPVLTQYGAVVDRSTGASGCTTTSPLAAGRLYATFFAFAYLLPLAVIVVCSVGILRHVVRHKVPVTSGGGCEAAAAAAGGRKRSSHAERQRQVSRVLALVVLMFAVLWLPIHIHLLVVHFGTVPQTRFYEVSDATRTILVRRASQRESPARPCAVGTTQRIQLNDR